MSFRAFEKISGENLKALFGSERHYDVSFKIEDFGLRADYGVFCDVCGTWENNMVGYVTKHMEELCFSCLKEIMEDYFKAKCCGISVEGYIDGWMITRKLSDGDLWE